MALPPILQTADLTLVAAEECGMPGYLVLRLAGPPLPLGQLPVELAGTVMATLTRAAAAIESVVRADRVYLLSFCEVDRRLHFHLFPRTGWLLDAWRASIGDPAAPVDGPRLFVWGREAFPAGCSLPPGVADAAEVAAALRQILSER